jgi:hypothetical protein
VASLAPANPVDFASPPRRRQHFGVLDAQESIHGALSLSCGAAAVVSEMGGIPIDYKNADFVKEIHRLTSDGVERCVRRHRWR